MLRKTTYTPKPKKRFLLVLEILLYVVGVGLLIQVFFVSPKLTNTFDSEAAKKLIISKDHMLRNSTEYQNWLANTCDDLCPIQLFYYYLFNITNPEQVFDGEYPQLQELGPFVFNRYELRKDVKFSYDGSIVSYKYEYQYVLNEELTNMSLWNVSSWYNYQSHQSNNSNDIVPYPPIYILNPFMLSAFAQCRVSNDGAGGGLMCNAVGFADKEQYYFSNETVQKILHTGMHSETTLLCNQNPLCNRTQKYIIDDDVYVSEYTGTGNTHDMRELITFYGKNQTYAGGIHNVDNEFYGYWHENEFFQGTREPKQWPYDTISNKHVLSAWMMDKFRSVQLISDGTVDIHDLKVDKFIIDPQEYLSAANNSNNSKYYQDGGIRDGLLNLTSTNGADVLQYSSKPYFLDAPYYMTEINTKMGLRQPNRSSDDTYFAINSKLGTVFEVRIAYMASFGIFPCIGCGLRNPFKDLPETIVPQFYVVLKGGAPDAFFEQYKNVLAFIDTTQQFSVYAGPAVALCCFVIALYLSMRRYCHWKRKHNFTFYMDDNFEHEYDARDENNNDDDSFANNNNNNNSIGDDGSESDESLSTGYAARDAPMEHIDNSMNKSIRDCDTLTFADKNDWKNTNNNDDDKTASSASKLLTKMSSVLSYSSYSSK